MSVYFIRARELDMVKIGYSFNPIHRFNHLRTMSPVELTLEGAIPGDRAKEAELHKRFKLARVRGEWFRLTPELWREIKRSSRPEKFTPSYVRLWVKRLREADTAIEQKAVPAEVVEQANRRIQEALNTSARRKRMTEIERLEEDGHIHFPFRATEDA
jgi:hypothetical protein